MKEQLYHFAEESNGIEGIYSVQRHNAHAQALEWFVALPQLSIDEIARFVLTIEPRGELRTESHHSVSIGGRIAPAPPACTYMLEELVREINADWITPWRAHAEYEFIHPFIDGNGRSGRAIWLWMMLRKKWNFTYPFLQAFYYQTLDKFSHDKEKR